MTKEQEEAIGRLHGLLVTDFNYSGYTESGAYWQHIISFRKDHKYYADAIETALSMLKEKDKEIEKKKEDIQRMQELLDLSDARNVKKDKIIDKIKKEVQDHIGFENRLKRDNREPDMFNQGRFYVANNINNILKKK